VTFVRDAICRITSDFNSISPYLPHFIEHDLPGIKVRQDRSISDLTGLSAIATLFSGVTATILQLSYSVPANHLSDLANTFYYASLILSIAAAMNSLLGLARRQAV
jgi:hypothetical protein